VPAKYLQRAGVKGAAIHSLRHSFATQHIKKGTSLETIQQVMGHQDIRTTEAYTTLAREVLSKELQENAL